MEPKKRAAYPQIVIRSGINVRNWTLAGELLPITDPYPAVIGD
jgi:hypothetical protein